MHTSHEKCGICFFLPLFGKGRCFYKHRASRKPGLTGCATRKADFWIFIELAKRTQYPVSGGDWAKACLLCLGFNWLPGYRWFGGACRYCGFGNRASPVLRSRDSNYDARCIFLEEQRI